MSKLREREEFQININKSLPDSMRSFLTSTAKIELQLSESEKSDE